MHQTLGFARRAGADRQCMQAAAKSLAEGRVEEAVALDAALARKGCRHDIDTKVGFSLLAPSGMTGMEVRLVGDDERGRGESLGEPAGYQVLHAHRRSFHAGAGGHLPRRR